MKMHFLNGTQVPEVTEAEYLGGILHNKACPKGEVKKRIKLAAACRMQLGNFWRKSAMNKKRKLQMYEALISAKLMYALDVTPLSPAAKTSLDAAFLRGVRQILNMKTTFAQKKAGEEMTNTNEKVLHEMKIVLRIEKQREREKKETERLKKQKTIEELTDEEYAKIKTAQEEVEQCREEGGATLANAKAKLRKTKERLHLVKNKTPQEKASEEDTEGRPGPIRFQHEETEIAIAQLEADKTEKGTEEWARAKERLEELKKATLTEQQKEELQTATQAEKESNGKEGHAEASTQLRKMRTAMGLGEKPSLSQTQKEDLHKAEKK